MNAQKIKDLASEYASSTHEYRWTRENQDKATAALHTAIDALQAERDALAAALAELRAGGWLIERGFTYTGPNHTPTVLVGFPSWDARDAFAATLPPIPKEQTP